MTQSYSTITRGQAVSYWEFFCFVLFFCGTVAIKIAHKLPLRAESWLKIKSKQFLTWQTVQRTVGRAICNLIWCGTGGQTGWTLCPVTIWHQSHFLTGLFSCLSYIIKWEFHSSFPGFNKTWVWMQRDCTVYEDKSREGCVALNMWGRRSRKKTNFCCCVYAHIAALPCRDPNLSKPGYTHWQQTNRLPSLWFPHTHCTYLQQWACNRHCDIYTLAGVAVPSAVSAVSL